MRIMGLFDTLIAFGGDVVRRATVVGEGVGAVGDVLGSGAEAGLRGPTGLPGIGGQLGGELIVDPRTVPDIVDIIPGVNLEEVRARFEGFGGGNGSRATRTIIETLDLRSGQIVSRVIKSGSPHIMNSDVKACRKVLRQSAALQKRIPRKTVRESATTKLKEAAVTAALANVTCPPAASCPPRC